MDNKNKDKIVSISVKLTEEEKIMWEKTGRLNIIPILKRIGFIKEKNRWFTDPEPKLLDYNVDGYNLNLIKDLYFEF